MSDQRPPQFQPPAEGPDGRPSFVKRGADRAGVQQALGRPPEQRGPRWPFVLAGLTALLLFLLVSAVIVSAIRDHAAAGDDVAETSRSGGSGSSAGQATGVLGSASGTAAKLGKLTLEFPRQHTAWQPFVLHVSGTVNTGTSSARLGGGGIVSAMLLPGRCPSTSDGAVEAAQQRGGTDLASLNAFENGRFQLGARRVVYVAPGSYSVCVYIRSGHTSSSRKQLVAHGQTEVVDGQPGGADYDATFVEPGRYVAKGAHVQGAGGRAKLEFVVKETPGTGARELERFVATGLSSKTCDSGRKTTSTLRSERSNDVVYDTFTEMYFDAGFSVTAGYWSDDEVRGQVYQRYGTCTRVIPFEAKRVK